MGGLQRNAGVERARGKWIAFLEADDVLTDGSLRSRWEAIANDPKINFVAGDFLLQPLDADTESWMDRFANIPEVSADISRLQQARLNDEGVWVSNPISILMWGIVRTPTVFVRKTLFEQIGGFDESLWVGEDFHLWMRLGIREKQLYLIAQPLAIYRRREGSITLNDKHPAERGREATILLLRDPNFRSVRPMLRRRLTRMDSAPMWHYRTKGLRREALLASLRVLRHGPLETTHWRNVLGTILGR